MTGVGPGWQTLDYLTLALVILTGALVLVGFLALVMTAVLERPWLIPRLSDENVDAISEMLSTPMQESDGIRVLSVHPALINAGRVPGFIIEQCYELERFDYELPLKPPYEDPAYEAIERRPPTPVPSQAPIQLLSRVRFFGPESVKSIRNGKKRLVFFGYFKYRGIFRRRGRVRETRFCWWTTRAVHAQPSGGEPTIVIRFEPGGRGPDWTRYT